ncbi:hypothetical protein C9374_002956 [Naegleria lovaniensis]|uniref:5'-nucleotidase n=1 Tax=Naegleria lovaniensis TaxID=51637 RepID=A0AA88GN96_NAELO|nr:uncharacterized protein C9374_002956 [Naegleria lovaniensis]KAG2385807.1 hypothetical protein C9374_002956 [Naegleria lovaniensis]
MSAFHWKLLKERAFHPTETLKKTVFTVIMVNDVYEMLPDDNGVGGLAELQTIIETEKYKARNCIATLNGDFMSASTLATQYKGYHMIDILNHIDIDYVTLGNHEFDFGTPNVLQRIKESRFKWVCSNVVQPEDNTKVLPDTEVLSKPGNEAVFLPSVVVAKELVKELREQDGCDVIIAMTHLTIADDRELARCCPGINLIIGGHDHSVHTQMQGDCFIHKAGHDAQYVSRLDISIEKKQTIINGEKFQQVKVFPSCNMIVNRGFKPNAKVSEVIQHYMKQLPEGITEQIGITTTKLDSSTESVRSKETTFANFVADIFKDTFNAELAIINGGGIRGDRSDLLELVEQGVAKAENCIGAFLHFSAGVSIQFDSTKPPMSRVVKMTLNGDYIDPDRMYSLASVTYLLQGGDGLSAAKKATIKEHPNNNKSVYDAVCEWIELNRKIGGKKEGRIYDVSKRNAPMSLNF